MSQSEEAFRLFQEAMDLPADQVAGFLSAHCSDDQPLREEVESLLTALQNLDEFLPSPDSETPINHAGDVTFVPASAKTVFHAGTRLADRYDVVRMIGSGGMGEVCLARDTRLDRDVALKALLTQRIDDVDLKPRFEREIRMVAGLSAPNIVTLHDVFTHHGCLIAVMEYADGRTLRELLNDRIDQSLFAKIARGISLGLATAHRADIMHRDIKPENIIISKDGTAKILDFGLARPQRPNVDQQITGAQALPAGTIPYMSPEQAEGEELTCGTDVFSLGIVFCEMLTGSNPYRGDSALDTLKNVSDAEPPEFASTGGPTAELRDLIYRMLSRDASRRPTAQEVADRLDQLSQADTRDSSSADATTVQRVGRPTVLPFEVPETRFVRSGDVHIAFQTFGEGPVNLVIAPGFISNVDNSWECPELAQWYGQFAKFARVAVFDKRGTGLSDRVGNMPSMDERMEDVCAVMDAAEFEKAFILGISEGGSLASMFTATYPHRSEGLILHGSFAQFTSWFETEEAQNELFAYIRSSWGSGASLSGFAPTLGDDDVFREWWGKFERRGANPGAAIDLMKMNREIDISRVLPTVQAPTLVIRREHDVLIDPAAGQYLADQIPNARLLTSPGPDHIPWVGEPVANEVDAIRDFIQQHQTDGRAAEPEIVLATVIAINYVDAGEQISTDSMQQRIAAIVEEFRGTRVVRNRGYMFSTFSGPGRAVQCAVAVARAQTDVRVGVHIGEIAVLSDSVSGSTVDIAVAIADKAGNGEVIVSRTVTDLVAGAGIDVSDIGEHNVPNVPADWRLFRAR